MKTLATAPIHPTQSPRISLPEHSHRQRPSSLLLAISALDIDEFLPAHLFDEIRTLARSFEIIDPLATDPASFNARLHQLQPEILVAGWKTPFLAHPLPDSLRYICNLTGSVRDLVDKTHLKPGLIITNWGESVAHIVAEAALMHILAGLRRTSYWAIAMHTQAAWKTREDKTSTLFGKRIGIHGFGSIARALLKLLAPFHTHISAYAPDINPRNAREFGITAAPSLDALFANNDIVVELAPLNQSTQGIVTEQHLRLMPPGSLFVNVGRGHVVDEEGLIRVAREGKILISLDVFQNEPLSPDHPLRGLPNVTLTPHQGGPTTDSRHLAGEFALRNLRIYAAGGIPQSRITPELFDIIS